MAKVLKKSLTMRMPSTIYMYTNASTMTRTDTYNNLIRRGLAVRQMFRFYSQLDLQGEKMTEYGKASMDYAGYVMAYYDDYYKTGNHNIITKNIALDESTLSVLRRLTAKYDVTVRPTIMGMAGMGLGLGFIHDIIVAHDVDSLITDDSFSKDAMQTARMARRVWSAADLDLLENPRWSAADLERHVMRESELLGMAGSDSELARKIYVEIEKKRPMESDTYDQQMLEQISNEKDSKRRITLVREMQERYVRAAMLEREYERNNSLGWSDALW